MKADTVPVPVKFRPFSAMRGDRQYKIARISIDWLGVFLERLANGDLLVVEGYADPPARFEVVGIDPDRREFKMAVFHPSFSVVPEGEKPDYITPEIYEHRVEGNLFVTSVASHVGGRKRSGVVSLPGEGAGSAGRLLVVVKLCDQYSIVNRTKDLLT